MALSTVITPHTHQSNPSHSAAHNALHTLYNKFENGMVQIGSGAPNGLLVPVQPRLLYLADGDQGAGIINEYKPSLLVARVENITTTTYQNDPIYSAAIVGHVQSGATNKNQPVGVLGRSYGHAQDGAYTVGSWGDAIHNSGATGGAMAFFGTALTQVGGVGAWGAQLVIEHWDNADIAYNPTWTPAVLDLDISNRNADGTARPAGYYGAGVWVRSLIGYVDVSFASADGDGAGIRTSDFRSDSHALQMIQDKGTHTYGLVQSQASISSWAAYLKSTGGVVGIDNRAAGQGASLAFHDNGVAKFLVGINATNDFYIYDAANVLYPFAINASGHMTVQDATKNLGFYGASPVAKQTGVAVTAAAIHAALTNLGLIAP